jgi:hypothetical protein
MITDAVLEAMRVLAGPPPSSPVPYVYHRAGIQGAGQAAVLVPDFIAVHHTDSAGAVHDWPAELPPGAAITFGDWTSRVQSINTAVSPNYPQMLIDVFVSSGITLFHPVDPLPTPPADLAPVDFGRPRVPPGPHVVDDLRDVVPPCIAVGVPTLVDESVGAWRADVPVYLVAPNSGAAAAAAVLDTLLESVQAHVPGPWRPFTLDPLDGGDPLPGLTSTLPLLIPRS